METEKRYVRKDDNSLGKVLVLLKSPLGDISVSIIDYEQTPLEMSTVNFMIPGPYAGGHSPNVFRALENLADVIEKDNKRNPVPPTKYYPPTKKQAPKF